MWKRIGRRLESVGNGMLTILVVMWWYGPAYGLLVLGDSLLGTPVVRTEPKSGSWLREIGAVLKRKCEASRRK